MKFIIILQARIGSSRLKNKMITKITNNLNLLEFILVRLKEINNYKTVIATTFLKEDDIICKIAKKNGYKCFRGSQLNLLNRIYNCADYYKAENIIRLTGDNPFVELSNLPKLADFHLRNDLDYSSNIDFFPKGVGFEIFSMNALKKIQKSKINSFHKEHINEYIYENTDIFKIGNLNPNLSFKLQKLNLTLDTASDLKKIRKIIKTNNYKTKFKIEDILKCI